MLDKDIVVSVKNLGKSYRIWRDPSARLKAPLIQALGKMIRPFSKKNESIESEEPEGRIYNRNRYFQDFQALKGVDLELSKGDSVGIIGRNGSGKSTLLQMIAGTLTPSEGTVETEGRVAALLELGAGFNDEFTGRENVYMNGTILGLTKAQIDQRFEAIVDFANIGEFLDQPIKTYSSGMRVRLAFAVQAEVDPDILIVDEALAVGDIRFTMKCIRRMRELVDNGTTLIFVSHDLSSIVNFCKEVIWIHDGEIVRRGDPKSVSLEYSNFMHYGTVSQLKDGSDDGKSESSLGSCTIVSDDSEMKKIKVLGSHFNVSDQLSWVDLSSMPHDGAGGVVFSKAALFCPSNPDNNSFFEGGEAIQVFLLVEALHAIENPIICCDFYDMKGNLIYGVNSCFVEGELPALEEKSKYVFRFDTVLKKMRNGNYVVLFGLANGSYQEHTHEFGVADALTFEIKSDKLSQRHHIISFDDGEIEVSKVRVEELA